MKILVALSALFQLLVAANIVIEDQEIFKVIETKSIDIEHNKKQKLHIYLHLKIKDHGQSSINGFISEINLSICDASEEASTALKLYLNNNDVQDQNNINDVVNLYTKFGCFQRSVNTFKSIYPQSTNIFDNDSLSEFEEQLFTKLFREPIIELSLFLKTLGYKDGKLNRISGVNDKCEWKTPISMYLTLGSTVNDDITSFNVTGVSLSLRSTLDGIFFKSDKQIERYGPVDNRVEFLFNKLYEKFEEWKPSQIEFAFLPKPFREEILLSSDILQNFKYMEQYPKNNLNITMTNILNMVNNETSEYILTSTYLKQKIKFNIILSKDTPTVKYQKSLHSLSLNFGNLEDDHKDYIEPKELDELIHKDEKEIDELITKNENSEINIDQIKAVESDNKNEQNYEIKEVTEYFHKLIENDKLIDNGAKENKYEIKLELGLENGDSKIIEAKNIADKDQTQKDKKDVENEKEGDSKITKEVEKKNDCKKMDTNNDDEDDDKEKDNREDDTNQVDKRDTSDRSTNETSKKSGIAKKSNKMWIVVLFIIIVLVVLSVMGAIAGLVWIKVKIKGNETHMT